MASLPITHLHFFTIRTHDLCAARHFYVDQLGFEVISEKPGEYVQVAIAGVPVCIDLTPQNTPQQPNQIGIGVHDLQQACGYLQGRGLTITTGAAGLEHWASIKDPDGHEILFIEQLRP